MPATLPKLRGPVAIARGPNVYRLNEEPYRLGPPGDPPPGFVTPKTSATEWPVYWGLARILQTPDPKYVRSSPFVGGPPIWTYQAYVEAGSDKSSNLDFVVWQPGARGKPIGIRVQTEFFHNFANNETQVYDIIHRDRLEKGFAVVDLYDSDYMRDPTGSAVIVLLKEALGLIERPRMGSGRTAQRV